MFRIQEYEEKPGGKIEKESPACYQKNPESMQFQKTGEESVSQEKG